MSNFNQIMAKWIQLDNQQNKLNEMLKNIKKNKSTIEDNVVRYMKTNNLGNNKYQIGNSQVGLKQKETSPGLSLKLIREVLLEALRNEKQVEFIIARIQNRKNIEKKVSYVLEQGELKKHK